MSRCFISYARQDPHRHLVDELDRFLTGHGHDVFLDSRIKPGADWVAEIETHLEGCLYFIVFISAASIGSEMVREEIRRAHVLYKKKPEKYTIIPIRLDYDGSLPYVPGAYLNSFQYLKWKPGDDFKVIAQQVLEVVEQRSTEAATQEVGDDPGSISGVKGLYEVSEKIGLPLPAADSRLPQIEMETGTITLDSPFYIRRPADDQMDRQLDKTGTTTIIKGARQMGKSSLLVRARATAINRGHRVFYIDFQALAQSCLLDLDELSKFLAGELDEQLKAAIKPGQCWKEHRSPMQNLTRFIEEGLLESHSSPLTLLLDEVDRLFDTKIRDDFFSIIRSWHNSRATKPCWESFNIVLAHSTEPYLWITDMNRSPFNVGFEIKMADFGKPEAILLNTRHGQVLKSDRELDDLLALTGGQPYLMRLAFFTLVSAGLSLPELEKIATGEDGPFSDHLRRFLWRLKDDPGMMRALGDVLDKGALDSEEKFLRLRAGGLVKGDSRRQVQIRCRLYGDYFRRHV